MTLAAVAMSGGVDSSVVALLLKEQGYEVVGITLRLWKAPPETPGGCCSLDDVYDAAGVARDLGIRHYVLDEEEAFHEAVVGPFLDEYRAGRTPSPCILCNQVLKFQGLLARSRALGADFLATGHYARVERREGVARLLRGVEGSRDQSYFLFAMGQEALDYVRFPLGAMSKDEARARAEAAGLKVAAKRDSQDLCFLAGTDLPSFLAQHGVGTEAGQVVHRDGRVLGTHTGAQQFTVGQRRGLGIAWEVPLYVLALEGNTVIVGEEESLVSATLLAFGAIWYRQPGPDEEVQVRIRSRAPLAPAHVKCEGDRFRVRFRAPQTAITPGQAVVVYQGEQTLGGGWIEAAA